MNELPNVTGCKSMRLRLTCLFLSASTCVPLSHPKMLPLLSLSLVLCGLSLSVLPRVHFPVPFSFPAPAFLHFVSDFPRKGLYGGHGAENTTFLTLSLGKQTKPASPSLPLLSTSALHCASMKSQLFKKKDADTFRKVRPSLQTTQGGISP